MSEKSPHETVLVLSQVYPPDPASVGQHMADAAAEMAHRGYRVVTLCANRGYNDPSIKYQPRENLNGVDVRRMPLSSFGKSMIIVRLLGGISFMLQCIVRGLFTRNLQGILVSTSPPMCSAAALVIATVRRRVGITYWMMDLNPDQMIEMGWIKESSPLVKIFNWFNRRVLKRARSIITLDRFMAQRIVKKADVQNKLSVMPPWPHEDHLETIQHADNPFREKHNLNGRFVIMYSGNHSVCTPLRTILDAALDLQDTNATFMFIGDGTGKPEVDQTIAEHKPTNMVSLPYQPLSTVKYSLSAADVHLVVLGNDEVGVRHPCKIYGAMALARPVLLVGPDPCHVSDLVNELDIGWHIQHGDVDGAKQIIRDLLTTDRGELAVMGKRAQDHVAKALSKQILCGRFCDLIEQSMQTQSAEKLTAETQSTQRVL